VVLCEAVEFGDVEGGGDGVDVLDALFFEVLDGEGFEHVGGVVEVGGGLDGVLKELCFVLVEDFAGAECYEFGGVGVSNTRLISGI
jgi:hypothetical protein